jgi:Ca-activated chloride channel family protein
LNLNKQKKYSILLSLSIILLLNINGYSQVKSTTKPTRVLFILDASGSMAGKWKTETKMDMAKKILGHLADSLKRENIPFALRVFGHQKDKKFEDCTDTKLVLPISSSNYSKLSTTLNLIKPNGYSPIALSLEEAVKDFPLSKTEQRPIIILISDGFENCSGDACDASTKLKNAGIYLKPYIIGLGLTEEHKKKFECVGQLFDIREENNQSQAQIASVVITTVMNPSTLQINLLNKNDKATETNVNMTFSNTENNAVKYNIYHTLNANGMPDTLFVDPNIQYNLKVHTLPPQKLNDINLSQGKHTVKALEAPQGQLKINMPGNVKSKNIKCIVKQNNKIINVQELNSNVNYIIGNYDLEILTTPIIRYESIDILQSQTKIINVASPGNVLINKPAGYLYVFKKDSKNTSELVTSIDVNSTKEVLSLQPGSYEIMFRPKSSTTSKSSVTKKITIISGSSNSLNF